ncbi:unnamed protein product [Sphagnum jensenii]|uniref:N-acetyltransferase ESCO acetyl-transferase domain-containing protein n=1 Tax=Sphagnum jensenii TaxID=128206 RepID=A0ABP1BBX3_9BRYO
MDIEGDASEVSSRNACCSPGANAVLITYKRRRTGISATTRMPRVLDSHTTETRGTYEEEESPQPVLEFSASKSNWLHELSTMWKSSSGLSKRTVAPNRPLGQYFLDLGQRDFSCSTCPSCGLVYARGEETDEKLHASFHRSQLQGIQFRGWQHERVAAKISSKGDRIIYVVPGDPPRHLYKVMEVVRIMEQEMGLVPGWLWQQHCKVYLFISASKKIVGCILCERISNAFPISAISEGGTELGVGKSVRENKTSSSKLTFGNWKFTREVHKKQRRVADQQGMGRVVLCSKTAVPAVCGVRGIWVSCSERRKGIASQLLDAMRKTFLFGLTLETSQCAFSQPTSDGQAFAARYCCNPTFLVYQPQ